MPRPLTLKFKNKDTVCVPDKVDRSKLYGYIDVEALDSKGRRCTLATLAEDGRTLVGIGGSCFAILSTDGEWLEKAKLRPVDREGRDIKPVASTYAGPVQVRDTVTIDEYLQHNIKNVYALKMDGQIDELMAELRKGTIFTFKYSFRGGLEYDIAFLLAGSEGGAFMCVGKPTTIHFVGLEQSALPDDETQTEETDDTLDFAMM